MHRKWGDVVYQYFVLYYVISYCSLVFYIILYYVMVGLHFRWCPGFPCDESSIRKRGAVAAHTSWADHLKTVHDSQHEWSGTTAVSTRMQT